MMHRKLPAIVALAFVLCNIMYFLVVSREKSVQSRVLSADDNFAHRMQQATKPGHGQMSLLMREKVETMMKDVNDSVLTNKANLPGNVVSRFAMTTPDICNDVDRVDLVIIVHTAPDHFDRRQRIRESFAKKSLFLPFQVRIAFLLGTAKDRDLHLKVMLENNNSSDSVIGDFIDHYHNLTIKGVMGYRWVSEHCSNARFVLKIDDDVLINTYKILYSLVNHMDGKTKSIFCNVWHKGSMPIVRKGRWKVESHIFSTHDQFPYEYCSGFLVLFTTDLMAPLYQAAKVSPFFWVDDVYLFGMLPYVVGGVSYFEHRLDESMTLEHQRVDNCTVKLGPRCPLFGTTITTEAFWPLWNKIKAVYESTIWKVNKRFVQ